LEDDLKGLLQAIAAWGLPGLFLVALLDSAGVPLPTGVDALLIALCAVKPGTAPLAVLLATTGSAVGCLFLFYVARKGGKAYLERQTQTGKARRLREWFQQFGLITVFISVLSPVPLPTKVFVLSAGALGASPLWFLVSVVAGRIPRYIGLAWLGSQLGTRSADWLKAHAWHFAGGAVALARGSTCSPVGRAPGARGRAARLMRAGCRRYSAM
jgi:membrane protein YqaA with SNARE-associated domain